MSTGDKTDQESASNSQKSHCDGCAIRHHSICSVLSPEELNHFNQIAHTRKLKAGEIIISEEEPVDYFANVVSGIVKLSKILPDGRQQTVALLFPPDFFGRAFKNYSSNFAEAVTDVELCCFPHSQFEAMLKKFPNLQQKLFEATLNELDAAREWMVLLGRKSAEEKVADLLVMIAKRSALIGCSNFGGLIELPLTRSDMADYLGLTIETVSRQFTRLKSMNIIKIHDSYHIDVPDLGALAEIAGHDL